MNDNLTPEEIIGMADDYLAYDEASNFESLSFALQNIWLNGMHDDEVGSVSEEGLHIFRVAQFTLETDSQGFTELYQHASCKQAEQYMESRI